MPRPDDEPAQHGEVVDDDLVDGAAPDGHDNASDDDKDDWGWTEDPDAPKGVDATLDAMGADLRKLTRSSLIATLGVALVLVLVEANAGNGFNVTTGFVLGGGLATLNLWILAGGYFAIVDQRATIPRVLLSTVGSLGVLLGVALWIILSHPEWSLGFGLGLAVPALGGILYALQNKAPNQP